ncbi:MAG: HD domain-containing protein [Chitinophagales bacterium]
MINRELLEVIYKAASIQRWNDHIRPHRGFTELDKQSHKMIYAYILGKMEETDRGASVDWCALIEGGIFEFLQRIKLTDLKPTVFHRLMEHKSRELNEWVLRELSGAIGDIGNNFKEKCTAYLLCPEPRSLERRILKAAHYLATDWEFRIIYHLNSPLYGLEETRKEIENQIEEHYDLAGVQKIVLGKKTHDFLDLVGQLRFQQRWGQSPRIPETSVMGHMLVVAMLTFFYSNQLGACDKRVYNNFFAGLFHDLPEVLTRDIVSPVKRSVPGLEDLIKDIEKDQIRERILPLLPELWHSEVLYFIQEEFQNKIIQDTGIQFVTSSEISDKYNDDRFSPLDGELVKMCDQVAAFVEASMSIEFGLKIPDLVIGQRQIFENCSEKTVSGLSFRDVFYLFNAFNQEE